jgi:hypothetical protein
LEIKKGAFLIQGFVEVTNDDDAVGGKNVFCENDSKILNELILGVGMFDTMLT